MWEQRFNTEAYVFGTDPAQFLTRNADWFAPGKSVLSVAEGEGRNAVWLAQRGLSVTGLEYAPSAVAKARKLATAQGVAPDFVETDVFGWDWPEAAFDVVMGVFIQFVGPAERLQLFQKMENALKPDGLIALHGYTPAQLGFGTGGPKQLENLYTADMLTAAFPRFDVLVCESYQTDLSEGDGHSGQSALIDFIARKPI